MRLQQHVDDGLCLCLKKERRRQIRICNINQLATFPQLYPSLHAEASLLYLDQGSDMSMLTSRKKMGSGSDSGPVYCLSNVTVTAGPPPAPGAAPSQLQRL